MHNKYAKLLLLQFLHEKWPPLFYINMYTAEQAVKKIMNKWYVLIDLKQFSNLWLSKRVPINIQHTSDNILYKHNLISI